MGKIRDEILSGHLVQYPNERSLLSPFLNGFDLNWAAARNAYKTSLSVYIIEPEKYMKETFGFNFGISLFVPHYDSIQPRTLQAISLFLDEEPLRGRTDRLIFFIIVKDQSQQQNLSQYANEFALGWIPIAFSPAELRKIEGETWGLRNAIARHIFTRDLFDRQLPIRSDLQFYGRDALLFDLNDAVAKGRNRGLFGLRKTGKTSVLFKLDRLNKGGGNILIYVDCKLPKIRSMHWDQLLSYLAEEILERSGNDRSSFRELSGEDRLEKSLSLVKQQARICLIFDEVEFVSFFARLNTHWHHEYIDFWQTLWSLQSTQGNVSFIICGVNALVVETDNVGGTQNPLFGIFPPSYLKGLEEDELRRMIRYFGRRMGLNFSDQAAEFIYNRYGGHPLLCRKACSFFHSLFQREKRPRPIEIGDEFVRNHAEHLDDEIEFYFRHILSELEQFYPDEYEVLCMGATGQDVDFVWFLQQKQFVRHLREYGIIEVREGQRPRFVIECLKPYLAHEAARKTNSKYSRRIVEGEQRVVWLKNRLSSLIKEFRNLNGLIKSNLSYQLFTDATVFAPEDFLEVPVVTNYDSLLSFLVTSNRLINDSIDKAGTRQGFNNFFFVKFANDLPTLQSALWRLRCYRHFVAHEELNPRTKQGFETFVTLDFGTIKSSFDDGECMIIQQIILDEMFLSIQDSIANFAS
jgi:hypothetical protein